MFKICTQCEIVKPLDQFHKRSRSKDGFRSECKLCTKSANQKYESENAQKIKERKREYRASNSDKINIQQRNYRSLNRDKGRAACHKWQSSNRDIMNALNAKRRAAKLQVTPAWIDEKAVKQYYLLADFLSSELGAEFNVDHVVPLQSDIACGLHWEGNLSLMLGGLNKAKGNRFWPNMP